MDLAPRHDALRHVDRLVIGRLAALKGRSTKVVSAPDTFTAAFSIRGAMSVCDVDVDLHVPAAHMTIFKSVSTMSLQFEADSDTILVQVPEADALPHRSELCAGLGRVWPTNSGITRLVSNAFEAICADADATFSNPSRVSNHLVGLLGLSCAEGVKTSKQDARDAIIEGAMRYIEIHLADPDLTPEVIAAHQHVSTRTLHRLFERDGLTVASWVRQRRLDRCRADLCDPALAPMAVGSIGERWGLCDAAHFSRLFKSTYGESPRSYRLRHRAHECGANSAADGLALSA